MSEENKHNQRRNFLKAGLVIGVAAIGGVVTKTILDKKNDDEDEEKVKVLTADGKLIEVPKSTVNHPAANIELPEKIREGIPGKKFVMVIDLSRCKNARKCVEGCQKMHNLVPPVEWLKVKEMKNTEITAPYWFPQPCYQCDNPPCTKVCPVDATFKRSDGIVAIDNDRCIGCKFCMAACPYSARTFNWGRPEQQEYFEEHKNDPHKCHTGNPSEVGTVSKCDFCPGSAEKGELPACVTSCPNGVIFFGDEIEDTVTNGSETFRLSTLLRDFAGFRQFEELGTKPRVYYLPQVNRLFPFKEDKVEHNQVD